MRNNVVQRSFVVTCVVLSLLLASMVAYEVRHRAALSPVYFLQTRAALTPRMAT